MLKKHNSFWLSEDVSLKKWEKPFLYNRVTDDLYEINKEALDVIEQTPEDRSINIKDYEQSFSDFCIEEKIFVNKLPLKKTKFKIPLSCRPSLRYLILHITDKCNLRCRHCYVGDSKNIFLPFNKIKKILNEFESIGGSRLIISGGEAILHPDFWKINDILNNYDFRSILLSNGTLISEEISQKLKFHEIQISLDGFENSHDYLRGKGSYNKTMEGIDNLYKNNMSISIATMIHPQNVNELPAFKKFIKLLNINEWSLDIPTPSGRHKKTRTDKAFFKKAAGFLSYAFGGGVHSGAKNLACGSHMVNIMPEETIVQCGFFRDEPWGYINDGLVEVWNKRNFIKLNQLEVCSRCDFLKECRGGCRYRAKVYENSMYSPDPVFCYSYL